MEAIFTFAWRAAATTVVLLFILHKVLIYLTPVERRLIRTPSPFPPPVIIKEKPRNNNETHSVVVGGSGCLGTFITRQLIARGDKVRVFDIVKGQETNVEYITGSILDEEKLVEAFRNAKVVFHAAAILEFLNLPRSFDINVVGTQHVINACMRSNVSRLVYTSSVAVLMDGTDILSGDESTLSYSKSHLTTYGTTKALAEKLVLKANGKHGLRTCALRPPAMFGPGDVHASPQFANPKLPLFSSKIVQGWMYIENAAHCHILAADALTDKSPVSGNYYFISDGSYKLSEFSNMLTSELGLPNKSTLPKIVYYPLSILLESIFLFGGGYFTNSIFQLNTGIVRTATANFHVSTRKAENDIGYKPLYSMHEAIKRTAADLRIRYGLINNYEKKRE